MLWGWGFAPNKPHVCPIACWLYPQSVVLVCFFHSEFLRLYMVKSCFISRSILDWYVNPLVFWYQWEYLLTTKDFFSMYLRLALIMCVHGYDPAYSSWMAHICWLRSHNGKPLIIWVGIKANEPRRWIKMLIECWCSSRMILKLDLVFRCVVTQNRQWLFGGYGSFNQVIVVTGWWFGTFFHISGIIIPIDYFSEGLKPPTR